MIWSEIMCPEAARGMLCALSLLVAPFFAEAVTEGLDPDVARTEAKTTVKQTLDAVVAVLQDQSLSSKQRQTRTEEVAYEHFDFATITRLVLARNWRRLSEEQRSDFVVEFKRHLSLTYGKTLQAYQDEKLLVDRARLERSGDVTVRTRIIGAAADATLVDYRLRKREDGWFVIDVIIEGVSLISNFRTQTQEIIGDIGPGGLIERLRKKNEKRASRG